MTKHGGLTIGLLLCLVGCDIPYKAEYDKAMELKAQAEQVAAGARSVAAEAQAVAAEAQAAAAEAQDSLSQEQNAINRLYTEE